MIVDVYQLLVTDSGGHRETYELRVQADTSPTLVTIISDAWLDRNHRKHAAYSQLAKHHFKKPLNYSYSELADYQSRQSIAQQGFCIRLSEAFDAILHLQNRPIIDNPGLLN